MAKRKRGSKSARPSRPQPRTILKTRDGNYKLNPLTTKVSTGGKILPETGEKSCGRRARSVATYADWCADNDFALSESDSETVIRKTGPAPGVSKRPDRTTTEKKSRRWNSACSVSVTTHTGTNELCPSKRYPPVVWAKKLLEPIEKKIRDLPRAENVKRQIDRKYKGLVTKTVLTIVGRHHTKGQGYSLLRSLENKLQSDYEISLKAIGVREKLILPAELIPKNMLQMFHQSSAEKSN